LFEPISFFRVVLAAIIYGGIEYRYINRREEDWTKKVEGFMEKPVFGKYSPYQVFFLLPLFAVISYTQSVTAWAGNVFLLAFLEDLAYFGWRGEMVKEGEWTTQLFGSFKVGSAVIPTWWPIDLVITLSLYAIPVL
jgi:hypothetical protein